MKNISIQSFMDEHNACVFGRRWVAEMGFTTCKETFEALCNGKAGEDSYSWALWFAMRPGVLSQREIAGFAAWCARRVAHLLTDKRSVKTLELAERFAAGEEISTDELVKAEEVASAAARAARAAHAVRDAADAADAARVSRAANAARDAVWATWNAACAADWTTAWTANYAANWAVCAAADRDAERRAQLEHLREIVKFEEAEAAE